jgi:AraC family transcriptional regulator
MLTYSVDFNASGAGYDELALSDFDPRTRQRAMLLRIDSRFNDGGAPRTDQATRLHDCKNRDVGAVEIIPAQSASRRAIAWDGIRFEIIQCDKRNKLEFRFRAPCHLLVVYEEGVRDEGEAAPSRSKSGHMLLFRSQQDANTSRYEPDGNAIRTPPVL